MRYSIFNSINQWTTILWRPASPASWRVYIAFSWDPWKYETKATSPKNWREKRLRTHYLAVANGRELSEIRNHKQGAIRSYLLGFQSAHLWKLKSLLKETFSSVTLRLTKKIPSPETATKTHSNFRSFPNSVAFCVFPNGQRRNQTEQTAVGCVVLVWIAWKILGLPRRTKTNEAVGECLTKYTT